MIFLKILVFLSISLEVWKLKVCEIENFCLYYGMLFKIKAAFFLQKYYEAIVIICKKNLPILHPLLHVSFGDNPPPCVIWWQWYVPPLPSPVWQNIFDSPNSSFSLFSLSVVMNCSTSSSMQLWFCSQLSQFLSLSTRFHFYHLVLVK